MCGSCHKLAAAGAKGKRGPDLGRESSSASEIVRTVTRGDDGMPAFGKSLTKTQIANIAAFVAASSARHAD
jgi:mono/diheme cytochrome c family protein